MQAGFLNDSLFFVVPAHEYFIKVYSINDTYEIDPEPVWAVLNEANEKLSPLKNFLLKQDIHVARNASSAMASFEYGSLVLKMDSEGIVYQTSGPVSHPLPYSEPKRGRVYSLPSIDEYPICALDIDVIDGKIYVLYSGEKLSKFKIMFKLVNPNKEIERISNSNKLFVFDEYSGKYLNSLMVPTQASAFQITTDYIYLLSSLEDGVSTIYKYSRASLSKSSE